MPTIFILIFALFQGIAYNSTAQTVTYTYDFSNLQIDTISTIQGAFSTVSLDDCQAINAPGCPSLPLYMTEIMLPVGKTVESISASYHLKSKITLANPIIPAQEYTHSDDENVSFCYNFSHYQQNEFEFNNLIKTDIQYARGYPILIVSMRPINYNPTTDQIYVYDRISFTLSLIDAPISPFYRCLGTTYVGGLCSPSEKYDYVIITDASLNASWQPLIDHRSSFSHLNCTKVTVQDIDACQDYWNATPLFNDTQAHIREFIKDAYQDWETDYILLGGDWRDGSPSQQIVPYRLFTDRLETDTYKTMPCDMYYSHLDGNWYYSTGSVWGGGPDTGANDKFAEVYIGRITAYNETMVQNAIDKIIWYDECNNTAWLNKTSFWGGNLGWSITSKAYMEELRLGTDTYRTFTGFEEWNTAHPDKQINTDERLYHADLGSNYKTYFSNSITNDNFSIVNHLDHSSYDTPFGLPNWLYRYNTKPFFGYSQGCLAGRFNSGYAGCEQMMCRHSDRHAFALVLNTGYGYGETDSTDGPGQYLNCYFWDYLFNSSDWQLGKAQTYSLDKLGAIIDGNNHAWCYNWYSSHLFGDPAQSLKISTNLQSLPSADVYVDDNQISGWYDAAHVRTIQEGINNATEGQSIFVYNGTYNENVMVNKSCNIAGESKNAVIDGQWNGAVVGIFTDNVNISDFTIVNPYHDSACISIINRSSINVSSCGFSDSMNNTAFGIACYKARHCDFFSNDFNSLCTSITLYLSSNNTIEQNTIHSSRNFTGNESNNSLITGIVLLDAEDNNIKNNDIVTTKEFEGTGFGIFIVAMPIDGFNRTSHNTFQNNNVSSNFVGVGTICLDDSKMYENTFFDNDIFDNFVGVYFEGTEYNNLFYHNNFINNSYHLAINENATCSNIYYNATSHQGNYWDDYDQWSEGAWDNNSDGIADSPRPQINDSADQYPLMNSGGPFYRWDIVIDRNINYLDVSALVSAYGSSNYPGWIRPDINYNGVVNYLDLSSLVSHYGESY